MFQVLVEDCHDSWTLTQCTARELQRAYGMPLQRASDLMHTLQQNPEVHPVPRYAQRNVSLLVSRAVLKFLGVRNLCCAPCCAPELKPTGQVGLFLCCQLSLVVCRLHTARAFKGR